MGHCTGGSSGDAEVSMGRLGRGGSLLSFSCLPVRGVCLGGVTRRNFQPQHCAWAGTGGDNLEEGLSSHIKQPVLSLSQDSEGSQITPQGLWWQVLWGVEPVSTGFGGPGWGAALGLPETPAGNCSKQKFPSVL